MSIIVSKRAVDDERKEISLAHPLPVSIENRPLPVTFLDKSAATSTTATPLTVLLTVSPQLVASILLQNDPDNTVDILVGNSISQSIQLRPGEAETLAAPNHNGRINLAHIFVKSASATPTLNVHALIQGESV